MSTEHTKDQSEALGVMMRLRELLCEVEERIDEDAAYYALETAEKILDAARTLRNDCKRWDAKGRAGR